MSQATEGNWARACAVTDLAEGKALGVTIGDQDVALAIDGDDVFAIEDQCSHALYALSEGPVNGCEIECFLHGSTFNLRTGQPDGLPATIPVATFPVEVRDGNVYVDVTTTLNGVTPQ
ncbi:MAG TPA: non-heme iron oxygenase ferredoxin subunit [Nocardioides sp.]|nr:non-heme iron oxygenase ferredoxin subunit [Nocardioides sp.]